MKQNRVLFLSAQDFKEKSIQVIRLTPEAYVERGWDVHYIVGRDTSERSNYFYEPEIPLPGARLERFVWPLARVRNAVRHRYLSLLLQKVAGVLVILKLALRGRRAFREVPFDVVYGYEMHGVLAGCLMHLLHPGTRRTQFVSRFQGTWLADILDKRQWGRLAWNLDQVIALRASNDLCIMTDDGTHGDKAYRRLGGDPETLRFWTNGTNELLLPSRAEARSKIGVPLDTLMLLSVSRLEGWKRVDRNIEVARALADLGMDFTYIIVGEGTLRDSLAEKVEQYRLRSHVRFAGGVPHDQVALYLGAADIFLSMYDLSNVGNPLLEAIRAGKIIVTLDNGDTSSWITHRVSGLIYDPEQDDLFARIADDIHEQTVDPLCRARILEGVAEVAEKRLWTWDERMQKEVADVAEIVGR